ncbi:MAG: ABC transporter permease subunit [Anaerolineaceae bacterium]|nr:ABC transporter permease subunit [Anaerolineaceae bacterium]
MSGVLLRATLRQHWRPTLYWSAGLALLGLYVIAVIPDQEALDNYVGLVASMPQPLLDAIGAGDTLLLRTPEGFIQYGFATWAQLLLAVYGLLAGLNLCANEEEAGILDVLLSLPLSRRRLLLERFIAFALLTLLIVLLSALGLVLGSGATTFNLAPATLFATAFNLVPGTLLVMAFTALAAAALRRHMVATGIGIVFVIGSYFLDFIASAISEGPLNQLGRLSFYRWSSEGIAPGSFLPAENLALLLGVTLVLLAGALWFLDRRDIGL